MTPRIRKPEIRSASGSGSESQRTSGWAPSRSSIARMIAPMVNENDTEQVPDQKGKDGDCDENERPLQELGIGHLHARPVLSSA
jgi:hypothetical protein